MVSSTKDLSALPKIFQILNYWPKARQFPSTMLAKLEFIWLHGEEKDISGMKQNNHILRPISPLEALTIRNKGPSYWELVQKYILKELSGEKLLWTQAEQTYRGLSRRAFSHRAYTSATDPSRYCDKTEKKQRLRSSEKVLLLSRIHRKEF